MYLFCECGWKLNLQDAGELNPDLSLCVFQLLNFSVSLHLCNRLASVEKAPLSDHSWT